jgi:chromosomal replication initiator protein
MFSMQDYKQLWDSCLIEIESGLSKANFNTWFKNTSIIKQDAGTVYIGVPNEFVKEWLVTRFNKLILKTLMNYTENIRGVEYTIVKQDQNKKNIENSPSYQNATLPLDDLYVNKEDNLNPRYILDTFIVGSFNELAYAASQAIIKAPGKSYNPFFVYGNSGLGKTHLIEAIGNTIKKNDSSKKIYYTTLERFYIECVNAIQANKINIFKEKYRKFDVLIIDDVQFITGKTRTQDELFHVFNTLYDTNKQIVFSSDKHPNFIAGLEDRLKSRFSQGMIVEVLEPEYESRIAILNEKAKQLNKNIQPEVIEYIASVVEGNIRELEGTLNSIICQSDLRNRPVDINEVKQFLKNVVRPKKQVAVEEVVKTIADFYGIDEQSIYEKTRRKEIVHARQMVMFILREEFSVSFPLIGQKLGGKDHTTVIHSCTKIKSELVHNPALGQELEKLKILFR